MKKTLSAIISGLLIVACIFAFTACGSKKESTETEPAGSAAASGAAIAEGLTLQMATSAEFPPYEYIEGDQYVGIDIEIATLIAEELGMELVINNVDFGSIIAGVQTGKFDMGMSGMTVTEERLKSVNFSNPYSTGVQVIIVKEGSPIQSVEDLKTANMIGVQADTTGDIYCSGEFGTDHTTSFKVSADAVQALISGKVDCVVLDNEPAKNYVAQNEGLKILDTAYAVEDYAICIAKENTDLLDQINAALDKLQANGKIDEILKKYIG